MSCTINIVEIEIFNKLGEPLSSSDYCAQIDEFDQQFQRHEMAAAAAAESKYALSSTPTKTESISVTVRGEQYWIVFTSPSQSVILDEFTFGENTAMARFEDHDITMKVQSLENLISNSNKNLHCGTSPEETEMIKTVDTEIHSKTLESICVGLDPVASDISSDLAVLSIRQSVIIAPSASLKLTEPRFCCGKTRMYSNCKNQTLNSYSVDGVDFKSYCWRHKQQILNDIQ